LNKIIYKGNRLVGFINNLGVVRIYSVGGNKRIGLYKNQHRLSRKLEFVSVISEKSLKEADWKVLEREHGFLYLRNE